MVVAGVVEVDIVVVPASAVAEEEVHYKEKLGRHIGSVVAVDSADNHIDLAVNMFVGSVEEGEVAVGVMMDNCTTVKAVENTRTGALKVFELAAMELEEVACFRNSG